MAPPSPGRRSASSGRHTRGSSSSGRNTVTWKNGEENPTQAQLLEAVLNEIRKLNVPAGSQKRSGRKPKATHPRPSDALMSSLVELEREAESTATALSNIMETTNALLQPSYNGNPPNLGLRGVSAIRAMAAVMSERLACLSRANCAVQRNLRDTQQVEDALQMSQSQRDGLQRQNAELQSINRRFQKELMERDETIAELEKQQTNSNERNASMNLQRQLQQKEAECSRMSVQIHQLESDLAQTRIDADHICAHLRDSLGKSEETKSALKRVARAHKERSSRMAQEMEKLQTMLLEKEPLLERLVAEEEQLDREREKNFLDTSSHNSHMESARSTPPPRTDSMQEQSPPNHVTEEERRAYDGLVDMHKEECSRAEQRLRAMDIRLRTSEDRNRSMANQLTETSALLESVRNELHDAERQRQKGEARLGEVETQLQNVRKERDALQVKIEELVTDVRASHQRSSSPGAESRLRGRIESLQEETARLRHALTQQRQLRESAERQSSDRLTKLRETEDAQKSLQRHIELLKDSYVKCFGDPRPQ